MKSSPVRFGVRLVLPLWLSMAHPPSGALAQAPSTTADTRPAFMKILTNLVVKTNAVVVTNYVTVTNTVLATNFYNAQGILLPPIEPIPGLIPIPQPAVPDITAAKALQQQAVRDLLVQGLTDTSNNVTRAGSFTTNPARQIAIPSGLTSFDRRKAQALITAMNETAEKAAAPVMALLAQNALRFQPEDPAAAIKGDSDAISKAFLNFQRPELDAQVLRLVQQASADTRLRETYNSVMLKGGGLLGAVLGTGPAVDIEAHVAQGLMQAISNQLTAREAVIRTDPAARNTAALQEAFKK